MVKISVVMPTYNQSVPFLKTATESILNQTFQDYEFIIIDDGSTNESRDYLSSLTDPRVRLIRNETNLGITKSLNIGFEAAQGKYIARMDSDDYSYPDRFQKQYIFMEGHPNVIVCGFGAGVKRFDLEKYRVDMLFTNPGPLHPSAFFNHEKLKQFGLKYDESLRYAQDYALWAEIVQYGEVFLFSEKFVDYRKSPNQISQRHREEQIKCDKVTQKKLLLRLLNHVTDEEVDMHYRIHYITGKKLRIPREEWSWYHRLIRANNQKQIYSKYKFKKYVYRILVIRLFPHILVIPWLPQILGNRLLSAIKKVRGIAAKEIQKSK